MAERLPSRRKPGAENPFSRNRQRRLERRRPKNDLSLRQWRKRKPKRPVPFLGRNQGPLVSVDEARRQIAAVKKIFSGGRARFAAYTNLLSRAFAGERNPEVVELLKVERGKIVINSKKNPVDERLPLGARVVLNLGEERITYLNVLKEQLGKGNLDACNKISHLLVTDTPKAESGIVASALESIAFAAEKNLQSGYLNPSRAGTIVKIYSAAGTLYRQRGMAREADAMFAAADALKARAEGS